MPPQVQIPSEVVEKWQGIVDLLAQIIRVPAALIMKVEPPNIKVFVSSESKGNPYEPDEVAPLNTGLYCETVMKTSRPLLVPDALADEEWKSNPDIKLGMISYLGFPVNWPDGETFGTICILDNKRNEYSELYKRLLLQFRDVLQADLSSLARLGGELSTQKEALREQANLARRSEKELREVIETIQAMVWSAPPDGSNTFVNRRWEEYTGLSAENTAVTGWQAAAHPEDRDRHAHKVRRAFVAGEPFTDEVRFRRAADGQYRWFLGRGVPLRDEQGNVVKCYGILTDIEDRKRAEALLAGEKRILEMVAKGDSLSQILDGLCRLVEEQASGVLASILLLDGNRLRHGGAPSLPKAYTDAIDGAAIGPCAGSCGTAAYRGAQVIVGDIATDPLWAEYRGLALPYSLRACWSTPVFSSQGKVIATFAMYYREPRSPSLGDQEIIEQITHLAGVAIERKLTEDKLQRSESYRAEAEKLGHTGSFAWDPNTNKVIYCSDEIFRIYGLDPQQALVNRQTFGRQTHPEDRAKVKASLERSVREKVDSAIAYRIVMPDGTVKHLQVTRHPVLDGAGNVIEVIGTMIDVTERKRAEEERERLRQLEADLVHINRVATMGELTASLAHEVNQPIAAAVTDANTCLRWIAGEVPNLEEAREAARRTVKDAKRAAEIVSRTRLLFKKSAPQCELIEVNEIIIEMVALLRSEASRYGVAIRTELASDLPRVPADRVQLQQVLMNLMINGIEAMKGVDRRRELSLTSQRDGLEKVRVSVGDTGVGLPAEGEEIFNAFFTTKPDGTGLGLAISRSITESHGGRLWAASNSGHGAIFHLSLPTIVWAHP